MQVACDSAAGLCTLFSVADAAMTSTTLDPNEPSLAHPGATQQPMRGGGRVASDRYRQTLQESDDFAGLEADANRYDLLLLVKRAGKAAGFTPRMVQLLDYYLAYTADVDWEAGGRPIVYQSLARTALDLGVSERQLQKLEKQLFEAGAMTWRDSGNHRRYGQRDGQTGRILYAFGADLTPLAALRETLEAKLHEKQLYDDAWMETKRQISWHRRQINARMAEMVEEGAPIDEAMGRYERVAIRIRTHHDLAHLRGLLAEHRVLLASLTPRPMTSEENPDHSSSRGAEKFAPIESTTHPPSDESDTGSPMGACLQGSVVETPHAYPKRRAGRMIASRRAEGASHSVQDGWTDDPAAEAGLQHITLRQALRAAGPRFWEKLPQSTRPVNWADLVEGAYRQRQELRISQKSWGEACAVLGRTGAALAILLVDRAAQRDEDPVRSPAAYFAGMIRKARVGELRLHSSIYKLAGGAKT